MDSLIQRQRDLLKLIQDNPSLTRRSMAEKLGVSKSTIERDLIALRERSLVWWEPRSTGFIVLPDDYGDMPLALLYCRKCPYYPQIAGYIEALNAEQQCQPGQSSCDCKV